jgi:hypothetical protein
MDAVWDFLGPEKRSFVIGFFVFLGIVVVLNVVLSILDDAEGTYAVFKSWLLLLVVFIVSCFFLAALIKGALIILYTPIPGW